MKNLGIVLVVIGILMMAVTGFNYVTRERVVDVGPVHIDANKNNPVQWSPILGAIIMVAGVTMVVIDKKNK